ncbi:Protein of unknown function [Flagellimonas taeanensis]|jgi:ABC-type phosphate/phosphonate transport system permease subunit|uniref:DUF4199 domain-containing protein n=1 Tax=Flagellimonas taeanensis TaxID=1005926 RepID=A0A1M6YCQ8_9FLAO|nr:DUF4199 domain-containing protein [Allomuricauda taeanensis]MEE1961926.1 DUF4199 domain-containing protein [Allomuricauda taeanensis]SFC07489.1 Protein of unknown function [Allomuricauda taeanensis]SHL15880.1 Protein of unknown function [Allomuricauda taeanensis]
MKKTVVKFGAYGAITICALFLISWFVLDDLSLSLQEVLGYVSIILSLSFVYFGIKWYRDKENAGKVSFRDALIIGILISLITALVFGLLDVFYTEVLNPDFMAEYYENAAESLRASFPADQLEAQLDRLEAERKQFSNPLMSFTFMALTVFVIGFIISLLSSLLLHRK